MSQTPAGWYVDAQGVTRWWDGTQWTEHTQPSAPPPTAPLQPDPERTRIREPQDSGQQPASPYPPRQHWPSATPGSVPPPPPGPPPGAPGTPGAPGGQWGGQWGTPADQYAGWAGQPGARRSGGIKPWMLIVAGVVVLAAIVAVVLVVVGGDDEPANNASDAPTSASVADFCSSFDPTKMDTSLSKGDLEKIQDKMRQVGTPADMPEDARKGWEWFVNVSSASDAAQMNESQLAALGRYYVTTCMGH